MGYFGRSGVLVLSLADKEQENKQAQSCAAYQGAANDGHPLGTGLTGLGQVKAVGVHDGQGAQGVGGAGVLVVVKHVDLVAVNGGGSGQQNGMLCCLGNVGQTQIQAAVKAVAGIVLDNAQDIVAVNGAGTVSVFLCGNDNSDIVLEQSVAVSGLQLGDDVGVRLQALDNQMALLIVPGHGVHGGGGGFLGGVAGDVPNTFGLIQLCCDVILVGFVVDFEQNVIEQFLIILAVGEGLDQVDAVGVNVSVVNQGIVELGGSTAPGQDDFVGVAFVTEHNRFVAVHDGCVSNAHGVVGVASIGGNTAVDVACGSCGGIDLCQTSSGHGDGHGGGTVSVLELGYGELCGSVGGQPGSNQICRLAVSVGEEFNLHGDGRIVGQATGQDILEGVDADSGGGRSDGGQGGQNLVLNNVAGGCGSVVIIAVGDVSGGTAVGAGVLLGLTNGLVQGHDATLVLGVDGNVVQPLVAAVSNLGVIAVGAVAAAVNGGHGQGNEEGVGSGSDHFGDLGLDQQVQTDGKAVSMGVTLAIGQGHCSTAVALDIGLQSVLDTGGIVQQSGLHSVDQGIRHEVQNGTVVRIGVCIAIISVQANGSQQSGSLGCVKAVQNLGDVHVFFDFGVGGDLCDFQVGVLNTLNGVAIGSSVAGQVTDVISIALTDGASQDVVDVAIVLAGGNVAVCAPHAVLCGIGEVILVDVELTQCLGIDGGFFHGGSAGRHNCEAAQDADDHQHCENAIELGFHGNLNSFPCYVFYS